MIYNAFIRCIMVNVTGESGDKYIFNYISFYKEEVALKGYYYLTFALIICVPCYQKFIYNGLCECGILLSVNNNNKL